MSIASIESGHELLRTGFDIDGTRVELLYDRKVDRYTVATRWSNLKHFVVPFAKPKWTRIMLDRASAVFESVCLHGATKEVARTAAKFSARCDRTNFENGAAYEREILRQTRHAFAHRKTI